jgi:hypothetical protein
MAHNRFVPAHRHTSIRMKIRLFVTCLILWLMIGAVGVQYQSAKSFSGHIVHADNGNADLQQCINEAFNAFEELLTVCQRAAAPNSHWQVQLSSWSQSQQAWEKASASLPSSSQELKHCALPLLDARGLLEKADRLFLQAQQSSDPTTAVQLIEEHEKSQEQARRLLKQAEGDYQLARNRYQNSGGVLPRTIGLISEPELSTSVLPTGEQDRIRSLQDVCRILREAATLAQKAYKAPTVTLTTSWGDTEKQLEEVFSFASNSQLHRELMKHCHCPVMTARRRLEKLRDMQERARNPLARDERSLKNLNLAIEQEKQHILTEIKHTEECINKLCGPMPTIRPPVQPCENTSPSGSYAYGFLQGFASCLGNVLYGQIMAIGRDLNDLDLVAEALSRGDSHTAATILQIKGERNRREFDAFIKSFNPNIYNVSPQEAGFRAGSRFCQFAVVPVVTKGVIGKALPGGRVLSQSKIPVQKVQLTNASALQAINAKGGVGYAFEGWRGGNLPANYKTIDRVPANELSRAMQNGGMLTNPSEIVSIKTISATPTSKSYATAGGVLSRLKSYMVELQKYPTYCLRGVTVTAGPNTKRIIEVGIPDSISAQQMLGVDQAAMLAREMGIEMRVYQLSGVEGW